MTVVADRKKTGSYYTPDWLVDGLLEEARACLDSGIDLALDPACGDGAFLRGLGRIGAAKVHGWDLDPHALAAAREAPFAGGNLVLSARDALLGPGDQDRPTLFDAPEEPYDLVVGNPPFLSQLFGRTARLASRRDALRADFGDAASGYVDEAGLFLLRCLRLVRPGGVVALVLPQSLLASQSAERVRSEVLHKATIRAFWSDDAVRAFDAQVHTCALVIQRTVPEHSGAVKRSAGRSWRRRLPTEHSSLNEQSWSPLLASDDFPGLPVVEAAGTLGEAARVTADFRDHFYRVGANVTEEDSAAGVSYPVITTKHIDPCAISWGNKAVRIARRSYLRPTVPASAIHADAAFARWAAQRLVPKVLVATQTRTLEAAVDPDGACVPLTPVVSVMPSGDLSVWALAAYLVAPAASAFVYAQSAGSGLSSDAMRVSASRLRALPLPSDLKRLDEAGDLLRSMETPTAAQLRAVGDLVHEALKVDARAATSLTEWWADRISRRGRASRA